MMLVLDMVGVTPSGAMGCLTFSVFDLTLSKSLEGASVHPTGRRLLK